MGSCFATHMGERLHYYQFQQITNPFGVIFHPAPMADLVHRALGGKPFEASELFENQGLWRCSAAHSTLAHPNPERALEQLNTALEDLGATLREATHLILTLGTAWGYRDREAGQVVANCHKRPAAAFEKELMAPDALAGVLMGMCIALRQANPDIRIILSVSPVRHIRDGMLASQRSKAHLITAVHQVADAGMGHYFPAYELLVDELRDYRFYGADLVHPNEVAVGHIWERFSGAWVAPEAHPVMEEVAEVRRGLAHRPLNPGSEAHLAFVQTLNGKRDRLLARYPHMAFESPAF